MDPTDLSFSTLIMSTPRKCHGVATVYVNGSVLTVIAGGFDGFVYLSSIEIFNHSSRQLSISTIQLSGSRCTQCVAAHNDTKVVCFSGGEFGLINHYNRTE